MRFKYIALNQNQKNLAGTIDANSEIEAREKLNKLGLAVLQIQIIKDEDSTVSNSNRFEFEARDNNNKKVVGTIAAENKVNALQRLDTEYQLKVLKLYSPNSTPAEIQKSSQEVIKLYSKLNELETTQNKNKEAKDHIATDQYRKLIIAEAKKIIEQVQLFLKKYESKLKESERNFLTSEVIHLQKILHTENTANLKLNCQKMLGYLQEKELFIEKGATLEQRTTLKLETRTLLDELKGIKKGDPTLRLKSKISFWQTLKEIFFSKPQIQDPQAIIIQQKITKTEQEIKSYLKLLTSTSRKQYRQQSFKAVKPLIRKWWRLKKEFKNILNKSHQVQKKTSILTSISIYLCGFYLVLYFGLHFISIKDFPISWPNFVYVHYTAILMYSIVAIFLLHTAVVIANKLERNANPLNRFVYVISGLTFLFIWLNL